MKKDRFYDSQIFRLILLVFLSVALIEIIFVASGFLISKYFFNIISVLDCISLFNGFVVFSFFAIEKFGGVKAQLNRLLLRMTLALSFVSSALIFIFANRG